MRRYPKRTAARGVPRKSMFLLFALFMLLRSAPVWGNDGVALTGRFASFACVAVCGACCGSHIQLLEQNNGFEVIVGNSDVDLSPYLNDGTYYQVSGHFYQETGSCEVGTCTYFHVATVRETASEDAIFQYNYSVSAGTTVSFKVDASTEDPPGSRYYAFYVRSGYGTTSYEEQQWQQIQPLSPLNTCQYTFATAGHYVVICHIKETENAETFESVGFSIRVE